MQFPTIALKDQRRPVIPVIVESVAGQRLIVDALVDTGSDISLFPERVAEKIGIDLSGLESKPLSSALGIIAEYRISAVFLEMRQGSNRVRWKANVGFLERQMVYSILGTNGFFEFFHLEYNAGDGWVEVTPTVDLPQ